MNKYWKILFFILGIAACAMAQRWAFVVNGSSETLSRIDLQTGSVQNHIITTGPVPNQIAYYDGFLYVVNSGSASLQIIDAANPHTTAEIPLPLNSNPMNVAFNQQSAYVTSYANDLVYKIDLNSQSVVDSYSVGVSPAGIIVFGGKLYVANTGFDRINFIFGQGSVTVIEIASGGRVAQINVAKNPQALIAAPDNFINVICTGDYSSVTGRIYFINSESNVLTDSLAIGGQPYWPCIDGLGIVYLSAGGWSSNGIVLSYNAISRSVLRGTGNPILVGLGSMGLAMDSTGLFYSVGQMANSVTRFDGNGQVQGTFGVGAGPVSIAIIDQRTGIEDSDNSKPDEFKLGLPYPNPFNSTVVIPLKGQSLGGELSIYNICGELVTRLKIESNSNGNGQFVWHGNDFEGSSVKSGIYFARIGGTGEYRKMVLLR